jgi:hypothetical protein
VFFPDLKVAAIGELYSAGEPMPDFRNAARSRAGCACWISC